jgi:hypothetical protein
VRLLFFVDISPEAAARNIVSMSRVLLLLRRVERSALVCALLERRFLTVGAPSPSAKDMVPVCEVQNHLGR